VVKKWDIRGIDSHPGDEIEKGETSKLTIGIKQWNQFRIERNGDTLYFKLTHGSTPPSLGDYKTVYTLTDPSLPDTFYVGFFAANREVTASREWQFDNVYVHAAPR
jgi:hypothetical protein